MMQAGNETGMTHTRTDERARARARTRIRTHTQRNQFRKAYQDETL
jgi:hypothetical protein